VTNSMAWDMSSQRLIQIERMTPDPFQNHGIYPEQSKAAVKKLIHSAIDKDIQVWTLVSLGSTTSPLTI
jgi:hypothetical protein